MQGSSGRRDILIACTFSGSDICNIAGSGSYIYQAGGINNLAQRNAIGRRQRHCATTSGIDRAICHGDTAAARVNVNDTCTTRRQIPGGGMHDTIAVKNDIATGTTDWCLYIDGEVSVQLRITATVGGHGIIDGHIPGSYLDLDIAVASSSTYPCNAITYGEVGIIGHIDITASAVSRNQCSDCCIDICRAATCTNAGRSVKSSNTRCSDVRSLGSCGIADRSCSGRQINGTAGGIDLPQYDVIGCSQANRSTTCSKYRPVRHRNVAGSCSFCDGTGSTGRQTSVDTVCNACATR